MKTFFLKLILTIGILSLFISCGGDDDHSVPMSTLSIDLNNLENLGDDLVYEGWIIVENQPISTGTFTINDAGNMSKSTFSIPTSELDAATAFVLSIEPSNDTDTAPSNTKILSGNFISNAASLVIDNMVGVFNTTTNPFSGSFILATPSDNNINTTNEDRGIWFIQNPTTAGLINLPTLNAGWKYEGWVVFNGSTPLTTGKFTSANGVDESSPYSGNQPTPPFPGEDFVSNLPVGVNGIVTGMPVVISIEPDLIGDSPAPFFLKPIAGTEGVNSNALTVVDNINATVSGTAIRN